jgi:hypothetical protein
MLDGPQRRPKVAVALQGGGSHGAYTWGERRVAADAAQGSSNKSPSHLKVSASRMEDNRNDTPSDGLVFLFSHLGKHRADNKQSSSIRNQHVTGGDT